MSTLDEKSASAPSANVLTIERPSPSHQASPNSLTVLSPVEDTDSTHSLTPTRTSRSDNEKDYIMEHTTSTDHDPATDSKVNINATDADLELGLSPLSTASKKTRGKKGGVDPYPCRATQKRMRKQQKLARAKCAWWANLSKTKRKLIVAACVLVLVAVITVMAVFISKATGSGVYGKHGQTNAPIS